ncbi:MAG: class I SAM-dependent methyltransferase [Desulfomonilaceae bacterium]
MSAQELKDQILAALSTYVSQESPENGLRLLLELDNALYELQGRLSVAYGGGLHTKHRHTRYHDFFTTRIQEGERVLDLGCGIGALAYDIANRSGAWVVGIDLNEKHIEVARSRYAHPRITYLLGDVLQSRFQTAFDTVVMSNVLEHLEARPQFLQQTVRVIAPRRFLIRVPSFERDWRIPLKRELGIDYRLDPTHCIEYTLETFREEMEQAGLRIAHLESRWGEIWAEAKPGLTAKTASDAPES